MYIWWFSWGKAASTSAIEPVANSETKEAGRIPEHVLFGACWNLVDDLGFSRCLILLSYFLSICCYSLGGIEVGVLWMWDFAFRSQWSSQTSKLLHWRKLPKTPPAGASKPKAADKPPNPDQGQGWWRNVQKEWSFEMHWASIEWCISCQKIQTIQGCRFQDASMHRGSRVRILPLLSRQELCRCNEEWQVRSLRLLMYMDEIHLSIYSIYVYTYTNCK